MTTLQLMKKNLLSEIKDFNSLDNMKQIFCEQFQNKYDFDLYIAPSTDKLKKKFELIFIERKEPYEKLFDSTFLKEVFPTTYLTMQLTLYVFLGEEQENVLFRQTLEEFIPSMS